MSDAQPAGSTPAAAAVARQLTTLDCVGIGINGIIGSGIFFLPAAVYRHAGGLSPVSWLIVGGLCFLVGLCFAEAASTTDRSGGPYAYATTAFGREIGYGVGFIALASTVLGYATVARGFAEQLAFLAPALAGREAWIAAALITLLGVANLAGIKPAAWTSDFFSAAKVLPILGFVVLGLFLVDGARLAAAPAPRAGEATGLLAGAMAGLFACTGFEFVSVPAGETRDPARAVPLALLGSLAACVALYALVQVVAVGVTPNLGEAKPALTVAAGAAFGDLGARVIGIGALISTVGFCTGSALVGPSYLAAFARDGMLPGALGVRRANGSPIFAVAVFSLAAIALANQGDFARLADIANVACVAQYAPTCAAVLLLRRRGVPARFRVRGGPIVPVLGLLGCLLFLSQVHRDEAWVAAQVVAFGFALRLALAAVRRAARFRVGSGS